jgi:hypothetical protein
VCFRASVCPQLSLSRKCLPSVISLVVWLVIFCVLHSRPLGTTQPLDCRYDRTCLMVKQPDLDVHRSYSCRTEVKDGWSYTFILLLCFMACYIVKRTVTE